MAVQVWEEEEEKDAGKGEQAAGGHDSDIFSHQVNDIHQLALVLA